MEDWLSVATQQMTLSEKQLSAEEDSREVTLPDRQQKCLQLFCLPRNDNGATYDWYKDRVESRAEGTCKWLLQHEYFEHWLSQESGPLLVTADPGCGKSVLAKYLVDHGLAQQSATICYFFFKDQDQNAICQALCALLHQLFYQQEELIQHAMDLYNSMGANLVHCETSLWTILRDAVYDPQAGPVIFVIDALDECDESQLGSLITNLKGIFCDQQRPNARFKVLMTSRPYEQVVNKVFRSLQDDSPLIHIDGEKEFGTISEEINGVIQHRVEKLAQEHQLSDEIKSSLNSQLLAIDHRTHLWVYLVFNYLDEAFNDGFKKTDGGIDAAIQSLPKTVNQAYDQILKRSQDDETVKTVKKALSIILAARRPLTLSEMNIAMTLDDQSRTRSIYNLDLEQDVTFKSRLRALCGVSVHVHHDKIYLLHQTAREFLLQSSAPTVSSNLQWQHSINARHAHSVLAEICLTYLDMLNATDTDLFCEYDHHTALFQYSVGYWDDHCREAEPENSSVMVDPASRLCSARQSKWMSIISGRYHTRPDFFTDILVASHLGFTPVIDMLLSRGVDIEARDSQGRTALMFAAESGHEDVLRLLLENGADVEANGSQGRTAFLLAAKAGHWTILRLLLENGANVEAQDSQGRTALMLAAKAGNETVSRLLLENGANVEAQDLQGRTALMHAAAGSGHEAVTRLLLEKGADVEAKDHEDRTALMLAAGSGHEAVARLLLENGANVKAKDNEEWTALMLAAEAGHEAVARLLLKSGAEIQARGYDKRTALILAFESGHEAITRLLLDNGADVESKDSFGTTALIHAAHIGQEDVTRLLLEIDANIEAIDQIGWTALMHAACFGHEAVTRLLVGNDANLEAGDNIRGSTALILAAKSGHEAPTRLLLENGANVEERDDYGQTALMYAAERGHEAVARLLLEYGADAEAVNNNGRTALIHTAAYGQENVAQLLLDNGVDVEVKAHDVDG